MFQTVAAVLHLGNVSFADGAEQDSSQVPAGPARKHLEAAAQLLGVPAEGLARALTTRTRQTTDGDLPALHIAAVIALVMAGLHIQSCLGTDKDTKSQKLDMNGSAWLLDTILKQQSLPRHLGTGVAARTRAKPAIELKCMCCGCRSHCEPH